MENKDAIIIGASTENPFFTLTNAIRSRSFLFEFKSLNYEELEEVLEFGLKYLNINISNESRKYLIYSSSGDARALLNLLEYTYEIDKDVSCETLKELRQNFLGEGVSSSDTHYDLASAMIKSMRGSDVDAALYYLARLIEGGESVEFISRRLVIFASEDIGNANPNALNLATSTYTSTSKIGYPESRIILAQCVVFLSSCPKSNSSYSAINKAINEVKNGKILEIPKHIDSLHKGYLYPHDFGGYVEQEYLEEAISLYESNDIGFEKTLSEWLKKIKDK